LAAGRTALDLAQKVLAAEHRKYELGVQPIFFILDAQTKLAQAQSDLLQAEINYQIAVAAVDHATGGLLQPYHVQVAELSHSLAEWTSKTGTHHAGMNTHRLV